MQAHRALGVVAAFALLTGAGSRPAQAQGRSAGTRATSLAQGTDVAAGAPTGASYFQHQTPMASFEVDRPRSRRARIVIASLAGGAVLMTGVGVLFTLDSKSKSDDVSTKPGQNNGQVYSEALDDTRRAALRSRDWAIASYAVGGGLLVGALVAYILTDPGRETIRVNGASSPVPAGGGGGARPPSPGPSAAAHLLLAPTRGGAFVGGAWSF